MNTAIIFLREGELVCSRMPKLTGSGGMLPPRKFYNPLQVHIQYNITSEHKKLGNYMYVVINTHKKKKITDKNFRQKGLVIEFQHTWTRVYLVIIFIIHAGRDRHL